MATLDILTYGDQSCPDVIEAGTNAKIGGASTPVDTSTYTLLRQSIHASLGSAGGPSMILDLYLETGPTDAGPWTPLFTWQSDRANSLNQQSASLATNIVAPGIDAYTRVRWVVRGNPGLVGKRITEYGAGGPVERTVSDPVIVPVLKIGCEGMAL